jgi:hypothetical protein
MEEVIEERRNSMRCYHDAAILKNASRGRLGLSPLRPPTRRMCGGVWRPPYLLRRCRTIWCSCYSVFLRLGWGDRSGRRHLLSTSGYLLSLALRHHITLFLVGLHIRSLLVIEGDNTFPRRFQLLGALRVPLLREECPDLVVEHHAYKYDEKEHDNT